MRTASKRNSRAPARGRGPIARSTRLALRCVVVIAVATAVSGGVDGSPADGRPAGCGPAHAHTLLRNAAARIYEAPDFGPGSALTVYGCALGQTPPLQLDGPDDFVFAFKGPALALAGVVAGVAEQSCGQDPPCTTVVLALDVSTPDLRAQRLAGHSAAARGSKLVKVGSLRVKADGSLAWITCPERTALVYTINASRTPNCVRAGDRDSVIALPRGATGATVLDTGRRIDPSSLRLRGSRLSWTDRGRRRHATL